MVGKGNQSGTWDFTGVRTEHDILGPIMRLRHYGTMDISSSRQEGVLDRRIQAWFAGTHQNRVQHFPSEIVTELRVKSVSIYNKSQSAYIDEKSRSPGTSIFPRTSD